MNSADGAADVLGDGAGLGVRHQASRAEHATQATDQRHHVGRGDGHVEVHVALLDLGGQIVGADELGTGRASGVGGLARGEHRDAHVLAGTAGQGHGAADHLLGFAWIDAQPHGHVDGLVELGAGHRLDQAECFGRGELCITVELLRRVSELLTGHCCLPRVERRRAR